MIKFQQQFYAMLCKSQALPGDTSKLKILNKSNPSVHNKNRAVVAALFSEKVRLWILTDSRQLCQPIRGKVRLCQPMTGCGWEHATSWTTESAVFKKVCVSRHEIVTPDNYY